MRALDWARVGLPLLCLTGCGESAPSVSPVRPVRSVVVEHKVQSELIVLTGQIRAQDEVNLAFRIDGKLAERLVSIGDLVTAGQLVARLNSQDEQNSLRDADASRAAALASYTQAQRAEERQRELNTKGIASQAQYDLALQQLQTAKAQLDSAEARAQSFKDRLSYSELHADAPGRVIAKGAEPGEVVRTGQMIVQLARQGGRDAVFNIPPQVLRDAPRDPLVEVALIDNPAVKAAGRVREVSPQADPVTRTYSAKIGLSDPPEAMFLGSTVSGRITLKSEPAIEIPGTALMLTDDKPAVWVIDPTSQTVALRPVEIARYDADFVVIMQGLKDGEVVVTAGAHALHPGQTVKPVGNSS
jgi:RND family efflux transporter MFP subunit